MVAMHLFGLDPDGSWTLGTGERNRAISLYSPAPSLRHICLGARAASAVSSWR